MTKERITCMDNPYFTDAPISKSSDSCTSLRYIFLLSCYNLEYNRVPLLFMTYHTFSVLSSHSVLKNTCIAVAWKRFCMRVPAE